MNEISTKNNWVAVEPVAGNSAETERKGGLTVLAHKVCVIPAKVVFSCHELDLIPGDTVYINGDSVSKADWAKKIYEVDGKSFILIPKEVVWLVKR